MLRFMALSTFCVNPVAYFAMREAAYLRHHMYKTMVERNYRPMEHTWHQPMLDWCYPVGNRRRFRSYRRR
jgi:hypothetical protein